VASEGASRGSRVVALVSLLLHVAVIAVVVFVPKDLPSVSKAGVVILFGSAIPRLLSAWIDYSIRTAKRLLLLRLVGGLLGLALLIGGALLD
jgi:hypothetical protein